MAQYINTNLASLNAQRNLSMSQGALATSLQRLSSGLRINSAKDDSAGLAISERMTAQVKGLSQAVRNANDGISLAQTAEGALSTISDNLQRLRELSVQSANASNSNSDRASIQAEANQLTAEITRVASQTSFNGATLLDGSFVAQNFQVGANSNQTIQVSQISDARSSALGGYTITTSGTAMNKVSASTGFAAASNSVAASATNFTVGTANGGTTANGAISWVAGAGADAIASTINAAASTVGVTATATNSAILSGMSAAGTVALSISGGNGVGLATVTASVTNVNDLTDVLSAINVQKNGTGVSASFGTTATGAVNRAAITLSTTDGRNINITNFSNTASGTVNIASAAVPATTTTLSGGATDSATVTGQVLLTSSQGAITASNAAATEFATAGTVNSVLATVAGLDLTSATGAQTAISTLDAALGQINSSRGALGAYQNRFTSAIANLQTTNENVTAARSRIQDTDFAAETASLTRAQILQQAGTAMLAQANAVPNGVLALLR